MSDVKRERYWFQVGSKDFGSFPIWRQGQSNERLVELEVEEPWWSIPTAIQIGSKCEVDKWLDPSGKFKGRP